MSSSVICRSICSATAMTGVSANTSRAALERLADGGFEGAFVKRLDDAPARVGGSGAVDGVAVGMGGDEHDDVLTIVRSDPPMAPRQYCGLIDGHRTQLSQSTSTPAAVANQGLPVCFEGEPVTVDVVWPDELKMVDVVGCSEVGDVGTGDDEIGNGRVVVDVPKKVLAG